MGEVKIKYKVNRIHIQQITRSRLPNIGIPRALLINNKWPNDAPLGILLASVNLQPLFVIKEK